MTKNFYRNNKSIASKKRRQTHINELDAAIIEDLLTDAYVSSTEIAKRQNAPLSTVQRRRRTLENAVLIRRYEIDFQNNGFRIGEITVVPKKGINKKIADEIISRYSKNISSIFVKIDSSIVLTVFVYFRTTEEIREMMEGISSISSVANVKFAETVDIVRERTREGIAKTLIQYNNHHK